MWKDKSKRDSKNQHSLSFLTSKANVIIKMEIHTTHQQARSAAPSTGQLLNHQDRHHCTCSVTVRTADTDNTPELSNNSTWKAAGTTCAPLNTKLPTASLRMVYDLLKHRYSLAVTLDKQTCLLKHWARWQADHVNQLPEDRRTEQKLMLFKTNYFLIFLNKDWTETFYLYWTHWNNFILSY